jgi:hypothetical protein
MTLVPLMRLITVTQAMILAFTSPIESKFNNIFHNAAGVIFLGTPHLGSSLVNRTCYRIRSILHIPIPQVLRLQHGNPLMLGQIADQFNNIWGSRRIYSFCETKAMFSWKIVIHHSMFLQHLSHRLLLTDCPQDICDHRLSRREDI